MGKKAPTRLDYALLGLIHQAPMSGYDLRKVMAETALGDYSSSPGAIYPALARLEKNGYIEGEEDRSRSLRPRKLYQPTTGGRKIFREWLSQEVTRYDVSHDLDEVMLRFAFHSVLGSSEATRRFLEQLATEIEGYVDDLKGQRKLIPKEAPIHARLALEAGLEQNRAAARWARKALRHFTGDGA